MNGPRVWLALGAANVLSGLIFGALGAHAVHAAAHSAFDTAVFHQTAQGLGLILMGLALRLEPGRRLWRWSATLLLVGVIAFSGGIYLKTFAGIPTLGPVVPGGGALMMLAWLLFAIGALRRN